MLKSLRVQNFKSLVDFKIDFEPFTVLIGKNGSGKTTVLQALELLSAFIHGNVNHFLDKQEWKASDLFSSFSTEKELKFTLVYSGKLNDETSSFSWHVSFFVDEPGLYLAKEEFTILPSKGDPIEPAFGRYDFKKSSFFELEALSTHLKPPVARFRQSTLSYFLLNEKHFTDLQAVLDIFLLDVQNSKPLRKASVIASQNIEREGKRLAGYLQTFSNDQMTLFNSSLKELIPQAYQVKTEKIGREDFQLSFQEKYTSTQKEYKNVRIWPEHISDGTLRIIALLATIQGAKPDTTLLLDEIENGIDPTQMGLLVQMIDEQIKKKGIQVILSTHSSVALNYVPEEGIRYFKREPDGNVTATNIFENGELKKMLEYMNAGEIWLNLEEKELLGGE